MPNTTDPPLTEESSTQLLDIHSVSELLGCSIRHVYRLSDAGKIPRPVKVGSLNRWRRVTGDPKTGIEDWIAAGCPSVRTLTRKN